MFKKIISALLLSALFLLIPLSAQAQYLCGATGLVYSDPVFCQYACGSSCEELTATATGSSGTCDTTDYEGFIYDSQAGYTYAMSMSQNFWTKWTNLATIQNSADNTALNQIMAYYSVSNAWIGAYDPTMSSAYNTNDPQNYVWQSTEAAVSSGYNNWASGQPNNALYQQDIGVISSNLYGEHWAEMESNGTWNDEGYHYNFPTSQGYAPYYNALVQWSGPLSCVDGTTPPSTSIGSTQTQLISTYCNNATPCYLCTDGTNLVQCLSGDTVTTTLNGIKGSGTEIVGTGSNTGYISYDANTNTFTNSVNGQLGASLTGQGNQILGDATSYNYGSISLSSSVCSYPAVANPSTATPYCPVDYAINGADTTCTSDTSNYSCPYGGTLSGTTCTYAATPNITGGYFTGSLLNSTNVIVASGSGNQIVGQFVSNASGWTGWNGTITYNQSTNTFSGSINNSWPTANNPLYGTSANTIIGVGGGADSIGTITYNQSTNTFSGQITNTTAGYMFGSGNAICLAGGGLSGCIAYTVPTTTYSCSNGGTLSGTTCTYTSTATTSGTTSPICPSGYTYSNGSCTAASTVYTCPSGGTLSGTTCTYTATGTSCPNGGGLLPGAFTGEIDGGLLFGSNNEIIGSGKASGEITYSNGVFTGSIDMTNQTSTPAELCPVGETLCSSSNNSSPTCPTDSTYDSSTNECLATPSCPSGYVLQSNNTCLETLTTNSTCPTGSTYNSSTNECMTATTATPTCPTGYTYDSSTNSCTASTTASPSACPTGTTLSNGECVALPICQSGYYYNAALQECTLTNDVTQNACPSGYAYNSSTGQCDSTATTAPACPTDYTYDSSTGQCTASPTTTTSSTTTYTCPNGTTVSSSTSTCTTPASCPNSNYTLSNGTCTATPVCPTGYSNLNSSGQCTASPTATTSSSTTVYSCPSGGTLSGTTCTYTATATTIPAGFSGYLDDVNSGLLDPIASAIIAPSSSDSYELIPGISNYSGGSGSITYNPSTNTFSGTIYTYTYPNYSSGSVVAFQGSNNTITAPDQSSSGYSGQITYNQSTNSFSGAIYQEESWNGNTVAAIFETSGNNIIVSNPQIGGGKLTYNTSSTTTYSCPYGGTLSGTTCTYAATAISVGFSGTEGLDYTVIPGSTAYTLIGGSVRNYSGTITYDPTTETFSGDIYLSGVLAVEGSGDEIIGTGSGYSGDVTLSGGVWGGAMYLNGSEIWGWESYNSTSSILQDSYGGYLEYTPATTTTTYTCPNGSTVPSSTSTCTASATCPDGSTATSNTCTETPVCSTSGYTFNSTNDDCEASPTATTTSTTTYTCPNGSTVPSSTSTCTASPATSCPSGYAYNSSTGQCDSTATAAPTCPTGSSSSGLSNGCYSQTTAPVSCPTGTTFSSSVGECVTAATCPAGYTLTSNQCVSNTSTSPTLCASGYSYDSSTGQCISVTNSTPICPNNYTLQPNGTCTETQQTSPTCSLTGFTYNSSTNQCTSATSLGCQDGQVLQGNQCVTESCPLNGTPQGQAPGQNYTCVEPTGSSNYYCSPNICNNVQSGGQTVTNPSPAPAQTNNGTVTNTGCVGQVYIFSGQAYFCKPAGLQTGGTNCCQSTKDWFGLGSCDASEQKLAQLRSDYECNEVGTYCSESFLGICLQTMQSWCCFGGELAELVQVQVKGGNWSSVGFSSGGGPGEVQPWVAGTGFGSADSPNCGGFTPTQFQNIDFSQVNLTPFYANITTSAAANATGAVNSAESNFSNELTGSNP